jgi:GNAT superfamily N-acetyltransferase
MCSSRLNTDYVAFTYLSDVYVDKRHRKRGLSKWFLDHILATEYVTNVRSVFLMTKYPLPPNQAQLLCAG